MEIEKQKHETEERITTIDVKKAMVVLGPYNFVFLKTFYCKCVYAVNSKRE